MKAASPSASGTRTPSPPATQPSPAHSKEELTEPRFVRSDLAAGLEVEDVRVRFALAFGELDRRRAPDLIRSGANPLGEVGLEPEDLHRPILPELAQ